MKKICVLAVCVCFLNFIYSQSRPDYRLLYSKGISTDLGYSSGLGDYTLQGTFKSTDIVGMAIAKSNNHVYVWFKNGTVSSGNSADFDIYRNNRPFSLPAGKQPTDIIGVGISSSDKVYVWYSDGTASSGSSTDLDRYRGLYNCSPPYGKTPDMVQAIAIAGSNDYCYFWYNDGTVSTGSTGVWDRHRLPRLYETADSKTPYDLVGAAITSEDVVYSWNHGLVIGEGYKILEDKLDDYLLNKINENNIPGMTIAVSKDGEVVYNKAIGYANYEEKKHMHPFHRSKIGSCTKIVTTLALMDLMEKSHPWSYNHITPESYVFRDNGIFSDQKYEDAFLRGNARFRPIVALAINKADNYVYTWYSNGKTSIGRSYDLDAISAPIDYELPGDQTPNTIRAIAISKSGKVYAWYDDGAKSIGTRTKLGSEKYIENIVKDGKKENAYKPAKGMSIGNIVGMAIAGSNDHVYTWYDDGTVSEGNSSDLDLYAERKKVDYPQGKSCYDVRGVGITSNDHSFFWYTDKWGNKRASSGLTKDPDRFRSLYSYQSSFDEEMLRWVKNFNALKIKHFLTHTTGFKKMTDVVNGAKIMFGTENPQYEHNLLYYLTTHKFQTFPGENYDYDNFNLGLTGLMVSTRSGVSVETYFRNMLGRIGLDDKIEPYNSYDPQQKFTISNPHDCDTLGNIITSELSKNTGSGLGLAAGGLMASAGDMLQLLLATDQLPNYPDLLKPSTLDIMEYHEHVPGIYHALGWGVDCQDHHCNDKRLRHNGSIPGGLALMSKFQGNYTTGSGVNIGGINIVTLINGRGECIKNANQDIQRYVSKVVATTLNFDGGGGLVTAPDYSDEFRVSLEPISSLAIIPNPVHDQARIRFDLSMPGKIELHFFDINGRHIDKAVVENTYDKGPHEVTFDASYLNPGTYICKAVINNQTISRRFVIMH